MNDSIIETSTSPAIAPRSIPKKRPNSLPPETTEGNSDKEKDYRRYCQLFGSLLHAMLVDKIIGRDRPELMTGFIAYLDEKHHGVGKVVQKKFDHAATQMRSEILKEAAIPDGYSTVWFDQLLFEPSDEQVKTIEQGLKNKKLVKLAQEMGYASLNDLAKNVITSIEKGEDYFGISDKIALVKTPDTEIAAPPAELKKLVEAIVTYYYFNFESIDKLDVEAIPQELRKLIALASARPDLIGLSANDPQAQALIKRFKARSAGNVFGGRALLDFSRMKDEEVADQLELIRLIRHRPTASDNEKGTVEGSPVVILTFVEAKTHFKIQESTDKQTTRFRFDKDKISTNHLMDMAHTLFAMHQYLTRMVNYVKSERPQAARDLLSVMTTVGQERIGPLLGAMKSTRDFVRPPHKLILARGYLPMIDVRLTPYETTEPFVGADGKHRTRKRLIIAAKETLDESRATAFPMEVDVKSVSEKDLLHATAIVARRFVEKITSAFTPSGREITEDEIARMKLTADNPNQE